MREWTAALDTICWWVPKFINPGDEVPYYINMNVWTQRFVNKNRDHTCSFARVIHKNIIRVIKFLTILKAGDIRAFMYNPLFMQDDDEKGW